MSKSIRVSPKYGVNPTIPVCFFCGRDKNEIALLGRLPGDAEAPHRCVLDYEPCDECRAAMRQGYALLGVSDQPAQPGMPPIDGTHYPTGRLVVLTEDGLRKVFVPDVAEDIIAKGRRKLLVPDELVLNLAERGNAMDGGKD